MDEELRSYCLTLFEACLAQIKSGKPGPSILTSPEFEATLGLLCRKLKAVGLAASFLGCWTLSPPMLRLSVANLFPYAPTRSGADGANCEGG